MYLRRLAAAALTAFVVPTVGIVAATSPARDGPQHALVTLPAAPSGLDDHYDDIREAVAVELGSARPSANPERTAALRALAQPDRQLLHFDAAGDGRVVEVLGDLRRATRIAILVPGADTQLESFDGRDDTPEVTVDEAAANLVAEVTRHDPQARLAVVTWLGYDAPSSVGIDVITDRTAQDAAAHLVALVESLHRLNGAEVALLCHSYGSVVCASAADDRSVTDLAVYGSPGMSVESVQGLETEARVWAARGTGDWIRHVPHVQVSLGGVRVGFGADPVAAEFGARVFDAGDAVHSNYLAPGSTSLTNLAAIALGREPSEVEHA